MKEEHMKSNSNVLVSIICIAYNHEKYIKDALDGFVNQIANFAYEVIIHDDASTDKTANIIKEYELNFPNIIKPIYQTENQYSKGVDILTEFMYPHASGKYVAFCEGDDYWNDCNKLQKQVDFLEANKEYSACSHATLRVNQKNGLKSIIGNARNDTDVPFSEVVQGGGCGYHTSSIMLRKEYLFNRPAFFDIPASFGDYQLKMYLSIIGKVRKLATVMSVYRFGTDGSWSVRIASKENQIKFNNELINLLLSVDECTEGKYHKQIESNIFEQKAKIIELTDDFQSMHQDWYKEQFRKKSLKWRITWRTKWFIKRHLTFVYRLYRKFLIQGQT